MKTIETCHCPECHASTKRTNAGKNQNVISILRGNGVEAYKLKIFSLKLLNKISCALLQRH